MRKNCTNATRSTKIATQMLLLLALPDGVIVFVERSRAGGGVKPGFDDSLSGSGDVGTRF